MATLEYTAVVVLLSIVLAIGGATFTEDGRQIAAKIPLTLKRGLCIVTGGGCDENGDSIPCVVSSLDSRREANLDIAVYRLTDGRRLLRERLSDGTFRITVVQSSGGGVTGGIGAKFNLFGVDLDADASGAVTVEGGYGRVFEVRGAETADRLVARLHEDDWKVAGAAKGVVDFFTDADGGDEVERFVELEGGADGDATLGALGFDAASASGAASVAGALRLDRRTRERALILRRDLDLGANLDAQIASVGGGLGMKRSVELVLDGDNRPKALVVRASGALRGSAKAGPYAAARGDRGELEAELDLTDPVAEALGRRLLRGDTDALPELARRVWDQGRIDVRHYRTAEGESSSDGASAAVGFKVGGELNRSSERARLVSAVGRDPGMGWSRRLDCELAAGVPLAA